MFCWIPDEVGMSEVKSDEKWITGQAREGIVTIGDPVLKQPCSKIADFDASRSILEEMVARLRQLNGAGLAALQVGQSIAAVVVEVRKTDVFPDRPESPLIVMANPEIIARSAEKTEDWEGCFSVPGIMGMVPRHDDISVRFQDINGNVEEVAYSGYLARVIQHEIDHLDAVEFIDRMESMESLSTVQNYLRFYR
jgi:peptide deformylase